MIAINTSPHPDLEILTKTIADFKSQLESSNITHFNIFISAGSVLKIIDTIGKSAKIQASLESEVLRKNINLTFWQLDERYSAEQECSLARESSNRMQIQQCTDFVKWLDGVNTQIELFPDQVELLNVFENKLFSYKVTGVNSYNSVIFGIGKDLHFWGLKPQNICVEFETLALPSSNKKHHKNHSGQESFITLYRSVDFPLRASLNLKIINYIDKFYGYFVGQHKLPVLHFLQKLSASSSEHVVQINPKLPLTYLLAELQSHKNLTSLEFYTDLTPENSINYRSLQTT